MIKHVIIGAGAAGITAAKTIREQRPQDEIVLISKDRQVSSRCMLHKYISGERNADALSFVPDDFFQVNRINWLSGVTVTGIDVSDKKVICDDGKAVFYDKLLIAAGAESTIPPIGALKTAGNVFGLRHLSDAQAIRETARTAEKVVVIGAGLVGLDAAYALLEMKKDVTVVEMTPQILAINLDAHSAGAYQRRFEEAGCHFHLWRKVTGTEEDSQGNVIRVILDNGTILPCDLLVVAAGVRPAAGFLEGSGIIRERAVTVDPYLMTNYPEIYAAGDVAGLSGIWPNAMRQGKTAALNMCGIVTVYEDRFAIKNTINFFGLVTLSVGAFEPAPGDRVLQREDHLTYQKVILRDGCVIGVILQGNISNSGFWQYLIKNAIPVEHLDKPIWKLSFADFCTLDESGEYRWSITG